MKCIGVSQNKISVSSQNKKFKLMNEISNLNKKRFHQYVVPVAKVLKELGIICWLDFGTLLGAVRDGVISDWDHDFDISVLDVDRENIVKAGKILQTKGFKVVLQKNLPWFEDLMQIYIPRNDLVKDNKGRIKEGFDHIDIYIYTKVGNLFCMRRLHEPTNSNYLGIIVYNSFRMINKLDPKYSDKKIRRISKLIMLIMDLLPIKAKKLFSNLVWHSYLIIAESSWLVTPCKFLTEFTDIPLYGIVFKIPKKYEKYLEYRYSEHWRIPDESWDTNNNGGRLTKKVKSNEITHIPVQPVQNYDRYLWE